jgi:hypothetical protein
VRFAGYRLEVFPVVGRSRIEGEPIFGDSDVLIFDWRRTRSRDPKSEILDRFLGLRTADDVEDFARVYGALGLCCHGLPHRHPFLKAMRKKGRFPLKGDPDVCSPVYRLHDGKKQLAESVGAWLAWVQTARMLLTDHALLDRKELPASAREKLYEPGPPFDLFFNGYPGLRKKERQALSPRVMLAVWANVWLGLSGVTLRCGVRDDGLHLVPCAPSCSLLGFIALQLAQALCGAKTVALCAACGDPCSPTRVTAGRNSYCLKHRGQGRFKVSKRKAREMARRVAELQARGHSVGEIAEELGAEESRIRRLIGRMDDGTQTQRG